MYYRYVAASRPTMYASVVTGVYFGFCPGPEHVGRHEISASKFGLQKNAMDCRAGVIPSVSLTFFAGGATTRWSVERRTSLLQRASRSPAFTTIEPGCRMSGEWGETIWAGRNSRWEARVGTPLYAGSAPRARPQSLGIGASKCHSLPKIFKTRHSNKSVRPHPSVRRREPDLPFEADLS